MSRLARLSPKALRRVSRIIFLSAKAPRKAEQPKLLSKLSLSRHSLHSKNYFAMASVLPGDLLDLESLQLNPDLPLKLGPGLRHIPPNTLTPTVAGQLYSDARKNAIWIEYNGGRVSLIIALI